jgi:hypothetical protein
MTSLRCCVEQKKRKIIISGIPVWVTQFGLTLEKMTHMSYSELLNKRLLAPTGMKNTFVATPGDGAKTTSVAVGQRRIS